MWTIVRKEVQLTIIDGKPVKRLVETVVGPTYNILYLALEDSTSRNVDAPSNTAYVAEPTD